MNKQKKFLIFLIGLVSLNLFAIMGSVLLGVEEKDVSAFFQERQTITFLSALQIAFSALLAFLTYVFKRILYREDGSILNEVRTWLVISFVLTFAVIDEYFMLHEGIDGDIATFFFGIKENPHLDGLTLAFYGVAAGIIFFRSKREILRYKIAVKLFCLCGVFFFLSIGLDLKSVDQVQIVLEESCKLIAVAFLFSGFVSIFADTVNKIETSLSGEQ